MLDQQGGKVDQRKSSRYIMLLGAVGTVFGITNLLIRGQLISEGQGQSSFIMLLSYAALAAGLFALIGGFIMLLARK